MHAPILITGSHRSGTTWVGKTISASSAVQYIPDSFAPNGALRQNKLFDIWFKLISVENDPDYYHRFKLLFNYQYTLAEALHLKNEQGKFDYRNTPARLKFYRDIWRLRWQRSFWPVPLLKDPIALFSAGWLHRRFNSRNIILIRHPAAFVSSLKRMNWRFDFNNFLRQPALMERFPPNLRNQISLKKMDLITEGCLLWNCIHSVIADYHSSHPGWIFKRHEDLSADPMNQFADIFTRLELTFSEKVKSAVIRTTSAANPAEVINQDRPHQLKRDSRANIKNWKRRLSKEQINRIRRLTEPIAAEFYDDSDW